MKVLKERLVNERGIVLIISLLIIALLLAGGIGSIVSMQTDFKSSGNLRSGTQAFYIADAGINHARKVFSDSDGSFDSIYGEKNGTPIVPASSFYGGTYTVTRQGSASSPVPMVKVSSLGTLPNNARAEIEAWFRRGDGNPPRAIETKGELEIDGNPKILGACGGAHANDEVQVDGNPAVQMASGLTASDDVEIFGSPCIGSAACAGGSPPDEYVLNTSAKRSAYAEANDDAPSYSFPTIDPADYASLVAGMGALLGSAGNHYILNSNGAVTVGGTCTSGGSCSGGSSVDPLPAGWSFSDGKWWVSGSSAANGVFYSETHVNISGSPGTVASPWQATIISRDKITVSGSPHVKPFADTSSALKNHLLVADDLEISGNLKANYAGGAVLVKDKVEVTGNPLISGFIIARGDTTVDGSMEITYNCDFGCSGPACPPGPATFVSWSQKF